MDQYSHMQQIQEWTPWNKRDLRTTEVKVLSSIKRVTLLDGVGGERIREQCQVKNLITCRAWNQSDKMNRQKLKSRQQEDLQKDLLNNGWSADVPGISTTRQRLFKQHEVLKYRKRTIITTTVLPKYLGWQIAKNISKQKKL